MCVHTYYIVVFHLLRAMKMRKAFFLFLCSSDEDGERLLLVPAWRWPAPLLSRSRHPKYLGLSKGPLGNIPLFGMGLSCKMCACAPPPSPSWKKLQQWPWDCIAAVGTGTSCGSKGNSPLLSLLPGLCQVQGHR